MTFTDSLILYATLRQLGEEYDSFADAVRLFELRNCVRLKNPDQMYSDLNLHELVEHEKVNRGASRFDPEPDQNVSALIAADFCEDRGQPAVAEWVRKLVSCQLRRRWEGWMPIGVRYGPSWLSFSGLDLIPCWHAPLGILEDGTYYNTLGPFALSLISNRYLPVLNLPSDTFGKWAEVGLPLSDRDRWL